MELATPFTNNALNNANDINNMNEIYTTKAVITAEDIVVLSRHINFLSKRCTYFKQSRLFDAEMTLIYQKDNDNEIPLMWINRMSGDIFVDYVPIGSMLTTYKGKEYINLDGTIAMTDDDIEKNIIRLKNENASHFRSSQTVDSSKPNRTFRDDGDGYKEINKKISEKTDNKSASSNITSKFRQHQFVDSNLALIYAYAKQLEAIENIKIQLFNTCYMGRDMVELFTIKEYVREQIRGRSERVNQKHIICWIDYNTHQVYNQGRKRPSGTISDVNIKNNVKDNGSDPEYAADDYANEEDNKKYDDVRIKEIYEDEQ